ncbi:MAG: hypothetical protein ACI9VR_000236 [Cognaticolwellia sp.]|jgi:hypothetical protein
MSIHSHWIQDDPQAQKSFDGSFLKAEGHYGEMLFR